MIKFPLTAQTATGTSVGGFAGLVSAQKAANVISWLSGLKTAMPEDVLVDAEFLIAGAVGILLTLLGGYVGRVFAPKQPVGPALNE